MNSFSKICYELMIWPFVIHLGHKRRPKLLSRPWLLIVYKPWLFHAQNNYFRKMDKARSTSSPYPRALTKSLFQIKFFENF
jgi:hypothetical protein